MVFQAGCTPYVSSPHPKARVQARIWDCIAQQRAYLLCKGIQSQLASFQRYLETRDHIGLPVRVIKIVGPIIDLGQSGFDGREFPNQQSDLDICVLVLATKIGEALDCDSYSRGESTSCAQETDDGYGFHSPHMGSIPTQDPARSSTFASVMFPQNLWTVHRCAKPSRLPEAEVFATLSQGANSSSTQPAMSSCEMAALPHFQLHQHRS